MNFAQSISRPIPRPGAPSGAAGHLFGGPLVAGVEVSILKSETHSLKSTAVDTAMENGGVVSDHVILSPIEVTVGFAMTNAGRGADQARDVFETFTRLRGERTVLELVTEHTMHGNMVVIGVEMSHEAPFRGALAVTVNLRQIPLLFLNSNTLETLSFLFG